MPTEDETCLIECASAYLRANGESLGDLRDAFVRVLGRGENAFLVIGRNTPRYAVKVPPSIWTVRCTPIDDLIAGFDGDVKGAAVAEAISVIEPGGDGQEHVDGDVVYVGRASQMFEQLGLDSSFDPLAGAELIHIS